MWKAEPAPKSGRPPLTILLAMGIAIGGAAVSAASDYWFLTLNPGWIGFLSPYFFILNLGLFALNIWFLIGVWNQEEWRGEPRSPWLSWARPSIASLSFPRTFNTATLGGCFTSYGLWDPKRIGWLT